MDRSTPNRCLRPSDVNQRSLFDDSDGDADRNKCRHPLGDAELWNEHTGRCGRCGAPVCFFPNLTTTKEALMMSSRTATAAVSAAALVLLIVAAVIQFNGSRSGGQVPATSTSSTSTLAAPRPVSDVGGPGSGPGSGSFGAAPLGTGDPVESEERSALPEPGQRPVLVSEPGSTVVADPGSTVDAEPGPVVPVAGPAVPVPPPSGPPVSPPTPTTVAVPDPTTVAVPDPTTRQNPTTTTTTSEVDPSSTRPEPDPTVPVRDETSTTGGLLTTSTSSTVVETVEHRCGFQLVTVTGSTVTVYSVGVDGSRGSVLAVFAGSLADGVAAFCSDD